MSLKTNKETFLQEILREIERLKDAHKRKLYRINEEITDGVASYLQSYFEKLPGYNIQMNKCRKCKDLWDITITFV